MSYTEQDVERVAEAIKRQKKRVLPRDMVGEFTRLEWEQARAALEAMEREPLNWEDRKHLIEVQGQLMRDWSEANWAAGWMSGLEELVWEATDPDAEAIKRHARLTGVWITDWYDDEAGDPIPTMPLDQWEHEGWPHRVRANEEARTRIEDAAKDGAQ